MAQEIAALRLSVRALNLALEEQKALSKKTLEDQKACSQKLLAKEKAEVNRLLEAMAQQEALSKKTLEDQKACSQKLLAKEKAEVNRLLEAMAQQEALSKKTLEDQKARSQKLLAKEKAEVKRMFEAMTQQQAALEAAKRAAQQSECENLGREREQHEQSLAEQAFGCKIKYTSNGSGEVLFRNDEFCDLYHPDAFSFEEEEGSRYTSQGEELVYTTTGTAEGLLICPEGEYKVILELEACTESNCDTGLTEEEWHVKWYVTCPDPDKAIIEKWVMDKFGGPEQACVM